MEGTVDLHGGEVGGVVAKPLLFLLGQGYRVEPAYPILVRPTAATDEHGHLPIDFISTYI